MNDKVFNNEEFNASCEKIIEVLKNDVFANYLGVEFVEAKPGYVKAGIPFSDKVKNCYGTTHGGALYALADIVAGSLACMSGYFCTTVSGNLNYLLPAVSKDYIYLEAKTAREGSHLVVVNVELKDDEGKLLDNGSFTFFKLDKKVLES